MSLDPKTADFARRFFRMVVLQCQFDACFEEAEAWAANAIELFPRDGDLLLARGSVREELATIGWARAAPSGAAAASETAADAGARRQKFEEARQDFEDALVAEPGLGFARVRLGRVQWRLGDAEAARRSLEAALTSLAAADHLYLAHLFLGRIHQDAHRLPEAQAEYRLAEAIHPSALSAGTALSNALLVAGEADAARQTLRQGLRSAGRRSERDPLWDYLMLNGADFDAQKEALHREALE
jgi:tetratricopeptide (TPR) repeat protein